MCTQQTQISVDIRLEFLPVLNPVALRMAKTPKVLAVLSAIGLKGTLESKLVPCGHRRL